MISPIIYYNSYLNAIFHNIIRNKNKTLLIVIVIYIYLNIFRVSYHKKYVNLTLN